MGDSSEHGSATTAPRSGLNPRKAHPGVPSGRFHRASHVEQAEHAGTIILFDKRSYFTLPEGAAAEIWGLLEHARSVEELVDRLHDEYDAPREVIAADVAAQLQRLLQARLIVAVGPGGEPLPGPQSWRLFWRRAR
jgi:hypothetical protein